MRLSWPTEAEYGAGGRGRVSATKACKAGRSCEPRTQRHPLSNTPVVDYTDRASGETRIDPGRVKTPKRWILVR
jgi:hypothetical protein